MKRDKSGLEWLNAWERDDWGYITTFIGKREFVCPKTGYVQVLFPDGMVESVPVKMVSHIEHINDMGHEDDVSSRIPFITLTINGLKIDVRLGNSGLKMKPQTGEQQG